MSGFTNALERKFYQVKSSVGAGERTVDSDVQYSKNKLTESHKKFKNVLTVVQKLSSTIHATNLMQVEVLTSLGDSVPESNATTKSTIDSVIKTFQMIDEGVNAYGTRLETDIITPLKTYLDQYKTMDKRFDLCHNRCIDMDRYHDSVLSISKKPPGKQNGLADAQTKYNTARDLYTCLKDEIIKDVNRLTSSSDEVVSPIVGTLLVSYTDYLNLINENWGANSQAAGCFKICAVDPTPVITPAESSMIIDANVFAKKSGDVSGWPYEPSEFDKIQQTSTPQSTAGTPQRRQAPPPPQKGGPRKERVRCNYEYTAQQQGELTFKEGDFINVLKKEGDWWMGDLNGTQGYFPSNYVSPA